MGLQELNAKLNDFFVERDYDHTIIGVNLYLVIILMEEYLKLSEEIFQGKNVEINPNTMPRTTVFETIELVKSFMRNCKFHLT